MAGNSRVCRDENNDITVEAQLNAFEAGLRLAKQYLDNNGQLPRLSVAFDHHGIFRLQFLSDNLTNSQKRRPRLSHLHYSIQQIFLPIAEKYQIPLSEINAIHEDSARQHLVHLLKTGDIDEMFTRRMLFDSPTENTSATTDVHNKAPKQKLTCAAITKEYFERAAGEYQSKEAVLDVFYEDSSWSRSLAYARGLQLSHLLGVETDIRLNLVNMAGEVRQGELITARKILETC